MIQATSSSSHFLSSGDSSWRRAPRRLRSAESLRRRLRGSGFSSTGATFSTPLLFAAGACWACAVRVPAPPRNSSDNVTDMTAGTEGRKRMGQTPVSEKRRDRYASILFPIGLSDKDSRQLVFADMHHLPAIIQASLNLLPARD